MILWQMSKTMGPCRRTRLSKAASFVSSRPEMNRSRSCASVSPDAVPALKSVSRNRPSVPNRPLIAEILPTISVRHSL